MAAPPLPPTLGRPVTTRQFSWKEMVIRQWGSEYAAPDHGVYEFSNGRRFDSTDLGVTGFYRRGVAPAPPVGPPGWITTDTGIGLTTDDGRDIVQDQASGPPQWTADSSNVTIDNPSLTIDQP